MPVRVKVVVAVLSTVLVAMITLSQNAAGSPPNEQIVRAAACGLPHQYLVYTWEGYRADRSPNLQIIPKDPNYIGLGYPHVGPWPYTQDVPLFWYGPGQVAAVGKVERPVSLADIAPTQADFLNYDFPAPDGTSMTEAVNPTASKPPALIITMVWDSAGRNVLAQWPHDWPYLKSLIPKGAWYDNAVVGSSPTSTAQDHANIGTGAFPRKHGITSHHIPLVNHEAGPFENGSDLLMLPTLADLYDRSTDNAAKVGEVASVNIHLGMIGHGSMWGGGDKDDLILRELPDASTQGAEGTLWTIPPADERFYRLPPWVSEMPPLSDDFPVADKADGTVDGLWRGLNIPDLQGGFDTPARLASQTRVIENLIQREDYGKDAVPDLLFINYKLIDEVGHIWTMNSPQMSDSLRVQDHYLRTFVQFLDREVGKGRWALAVTADHGAVPDPAVSGAVQMAGPAITTAIDDKFDHDGDDTSLVTSVRQTGISIDPDQLAANGANLTDIAAFVMTLTDAQTAIPGTVVPPGKGGDLAFSAAFPSEMMTSLSCLPEAKA